MSNEENHLVTQRRQKLQDARDKGNAFPNDWRVDSWAGDLAQTYAQADEAALALAPELSVAGRMMAKRVMGKASFAQLQDVSGRIQLFVQRDALGEEAYKDFKQLDVGDIVGAKGRLFRTKTGELSIKVSALKLLTKSLRPLPEKFHGLSDQETRYRMRYVDLIVNPEVRNTFILRSKMIEYIRNFLTARQFLEVETPMMHVIPGGASARPFTTHHNALDMPLYLRIAPELYLKRLVVGGFDRVFEINRNFRNEGLSTRHNPEFTMLEFYWGYANYHDLMDFTEELLRTMAQDLLGDTQLVNESGELVCDLGAPFRRWTMAESVLAHNPELTEAQVWDIDALKARLGDLKVSVEGSWGVGKCLTELFEATVEGQLMAPTFITQYPTETSPLARRCDSNPNVTDRFEFFVGGRELANGFSELNDAQDQAERFAAQMRDKEAGDAEAMFYDADYIRALEYGLPPTAGEGIGIDRLVMLFAQAASIRDVILFPHMRPESAPVAPDGK